MELIHPSATKEEKGMRMLLHPGICPGLVQAQAAASHDLGGVTCYPRVLLEKVGATEIRCTFFPLLAQQFPLFFPGLNLKFVLCFLFLFLIFAGLLLP